MRLKVFGEFYEVTGEQFEEFAQLYGECVQERGPCAFCKAEKCPALEYLAQKGLMREERRPHGAQSK